VSVSDGQATPPVDGVDLPPAVSRMVRRQRIMLGVAVTAAVLSGTGLGLSVLVKSPAQQAAEQAPPTPSVLTAPVQRKVLHGSLSVRGTVRPAGSVRVPAVTPAGADVAAISRTPRAVGDELRPGNVLIEVSGRPVIVLGGAVPMYRDLNPGDTGPDVTQLQKALRGVGYPVGASGTFDPATQRAVRRLYTDRGYRPVNTPATPTGSGPTASPSTPAGPAPTGSTPATSPTTPPQVRVPRGEVAFVPAFPAHVGSLAGGVGAVLDPSAGPLATIDSGGLTVRGLIPVGDGTKIRRGQPVTILDETGGRTGTGIAASVGPFTAGTTSGAGGSGAAPAQGGAVDAGAQPGTGGESPAGGPGYPLTVTPSGRLDHSWLGADVVLTVATESTTGEVLVVPVSAIRKAADEGTSVTVRLPGGTQHRVPVTTGLTADGEVEVRPSAGSQLDVGDTVVTGQ
jgi:hypothetical protein